MQKITPFLWFDDQAEEAVNFYTSLFKNSKIGRIFRYTEEAAEKTGRPVGSVLTIEFEIEGQTFVALNDGGEESACGWLKDKFGLSWQVTPTVLIDMLHDSDQEKSGRVMQAMLQMKKIDIKALKDAYTR
jgi:predicted 3-demethylubiquinone-9 3-methyltransferase (glyoxalase superfamily)